MLINAKQYEVPILSTNTTNLQNHVDETNFFFKLLRFSINALFYNHILMADTIILGGKLDGVLKYHMVNCLIFHLPLILYTISVRLLL